MENLANRIDLQGELVSLPELSHENHGQRFYRFYLDVERLSGVCDRLPVIASEQVLWDMDLSDGATVAGSGQIRSYNAKWDTRRKLLVFVYAQRLYTCEAAPLNEVFLSGTVCKPPVFRRTPLGRQICDIMLAVPRTFRRADYLPCILWGKTAQLGSHCHTRQRLQICGRLQSRIYTKLTEDGAMEHTAYEISALSATLCDAE